MGTGNLEVIIIAGGCFWCTEAIFKRLKGVVKVEPGYAGGKTENPSYEEVTSGNTGHAEAIQVTFDPAVISLDMMFDVFWAIHDPTTLNRQGNDVGTQYRSAIFYQNPAQKEAAEKSKAAKQIKLKDPIVTEIVPFTNFYLAEDYHKNYYDQNRSKNAYCPLVIDPKIQKLMEKFKNEVKDEYK